MALTRSQQYLLSAQCGYSGSPNAARQPSKVVQLRHLVYNLQEPEVETAFIRMAASAKKALIHDEEFFFQDVIIQVRISNICPRLPIIVCLRWRIGFSKFLVVSSYKNLKCFEICFHYPCRRASWRRVHPKTIL